MRHARLARKTVVIIKTRHGLASRTQFIQLSVVGRVAGETVSVNIARKTVVGAVRTERRELAGIDHNLNAFVVAQVGSSQIVGIIASLAIGK